MTPTPPSITAGSDLLAGWLRRAARVEGTGDLLLRGSLLLRAWCPARARIPADVDYLVAAEFDAARLANVARAIVAEDDRGTTFELERTELTWQETAFPGLRAHVRAGDACFHVDFGCGDPLSQPPQRMHLPDVGEVLACPPETLFAWKLHGLVEFGTGRWRAKDLYDLDLLWQEVAMGREALLPAVELAFVSRGLPLAALHDFRTRHSWGTSRSGTRKWRALAKHVPVDDFEITRARVRTAVDAVLGCL